MKSNVIERFFSCSIQQSAFVGVIYCALAGFVLLVAPFVVHAEEGQGPLINFSIVATKDGATTPLSGIYFETFTLTNHPITPSDLGKVDSKGNIVNFRFRKTGADGITTFETLSPEGAQYGTTPIDIDGDGQMDTFRIVGSPKAYTANPDKELTVNINGVEITEDPKYCMASGNYKFTRLKNDTRNVRGGDCELESGMNFLCGTSPFYARPVMRKDMQGTFVFKAVSHSNGEQKPLAECTGPYTQDFGESNNYGACVTDDPLGRGFKVVRWGHGNSIANLTFFVEFVSEVPTPSKSVERMDANIKETEWQNFYCTESRSCADEAAGCTAKASEGKKRVKVGGILAVLDRLQNALPTGEPIYLVECVAANGTDLSSRNSYSCTTGDPAIDSRLGIEAGNFPVAVFGKNGVPLADRNLRASTNAGLDEVEWESLSIPDTTSMFMLGFRPGLTTSAPDGSIGGQQFATLTSATGCTVLKDPYGIVFDSVTGVPLANAEVLLTMKSPAGTQVPVTARDVYGERTNRTFTNPVTTGADGAFAFMVPDGNYKLFVRKPGYQFPATIPLDPQISSKYGPLYDGTWIVQKGEPVRRNIPLMSVPSK
ncbi:MAG: carboxypeptidase-like regulatory domain-containing protein [Patescibacteria group bacterium]|nr:carboxypeptidase-like regulatory domain-containing protein [Patescibacteria group bacterium]